jgi:hypothetical protein
VRRKRKPKNKFGFKGWKERQLKLPFGDLTDVNL